MQFLETGAGWDSWLLSFVATELILPAPSPQLYSCSLMSPCLAFVTDHPAPTCFDYCLGSNMDCSKGQGGLSESFFGFRMHRGMDIRREIWMDLFVCWLDGLEIGLSAHLSNIYSISTQISEGGNWAITINELRKCMETAFIIYPIWYIIHGEKLEYLLRTVSWELTGQILHESKRLRPHQDTHLPIKKQSSNISHALLQPSSWAYEPSCLSTPPQPTFEVVQAPLSHSHHCQQTIPILEK